ncbi:glycoprotein 3-alpha-L-fucosyltransferase A-like isoform X2 [Prosopis cineraria]|uniref:glycoprotein 3-alpha-L-fucosyltransferase A-like isoform X2 n=1 Tax=Prosopis cineraria TaxID=364024 RepID=UPI0024100ACB|nr:glycoprotein 3-alpha-L-fucosyltransferase A-like isoform X2 [Prosopis cineraria]
MTKVGIWRGKYMRMMGLVTNSRGSRTEAIHEGLPVSTLAVPRRKWGNLMPLFAIFVVIAEIAFLTRLDLAKNAAMVDTVADFFYGSREEATFDNLGFATLGGDSNSEYLYQKKSNSEYESCEKWLEREDAVTYSRNFTTDPILVVGAMQEEISCSLGCKFGSDEGRAPDASFGSPRQDGMAHIRRSMESTIYFQENDIAVARRWGYDVVMTTSLSSDVPVGYFSWAEYDIMAPVQPKTESALAAAFISNCGAPNFRLQALEALEKLNVKIDSYGGCHRNRDERVDKVEALKRYKFSLAFENSNVEDYVTEKFFQSLVAGSIPVVVGAPNIQDFAPSPGSILHIKKLTDVESVAKSMKTLAENPEAYAQYLRWKYEGPSDSFKALLDMAVVHSSCRLCIHLASAIREKEEKSPGFKKRPCSCTRGSETVYHVYVRERGRFDMESIFLRSGNFTLEAMKSAVISKFASLNHVPIWRSERPESIRGSSELKIYRIYPLGMTQRRALYTFSFKGDDDFRNHLETNPCAKFEVIFV